MNVFCVVSERLTIVLLGNMFKPGYCIHRILWFWQRRRAGSAAAAAAGYIFLWAEHSPDRLTDCSEIWYAHIWL